TRRLTRFRLQEPRRRRVRLELQLRRRHRLLRPRSNALSLQEERPSSSRRPFLFYRAADFFPAFCLLPCKIVWICCRWFSACPATIFTMWFTLSLPRSAWTP